MSACHHCGHAWIDHEANSFSGTTPCTHNIAVAVLDNSDLETWAVTFCKCQDYIEPEPGGFPVMDADI